MSKSFNERCFEKRCIFYLNSLQAFYEEGEYIIRQGARGDTFFILRKGNVRSFFVILYVELYSPEFERLSRLFFILIVLG